MRQQIKVLFSVALTVLLLLCACAQSEGNFLFWEEAAEVVIDEKIVEPVPEETPDPVWEKEPAAEVVESPHILPSDENRSKLETRVEPEMVPGFLPVCYGCTTDRKVVAITIDDCNQANNLKSILSLINKTGGKATIFPIGENISFLGELLTAAWEYGFEIENHTWDHCGLYSVSDEEMCRQIYRQNAAISELLGVEYQMHFLRPRGGDNRYDQRTHAYLRQIGYYGVAYWSHVGVKTSTSALMKNIEPGDILLYHTTDEDLAQLKELVPWLVREGYTLVTMNELYGLPANETGTLADHSVPELLKPYEHFGQIFRKNDYLHDVLLIQKRLSQLGFLDANYNGYYGDATARAVKAFQESKGLSADGICGEDTWNALFPDGV